MIYPFYKTNYKTKQSGITILELLVSLVVFYFGIIGIFGFQLSVSRCNLSARRLSTAIFLAEEKMEDLKGQGYGNITNGSDAVYRSGCTYNRAWSIDPNYQNSADMEQVNVVIAWSDKNRVHHFSLHDILSKIMDGAT